MRKRTKARELALQLLYRYDISKDADVEGLAEFWTEPGEVDEEVKEFAKKLFFGIIENLEPIDSKIVSYAANWDLSRMAVVDRNVLRLCSFELLYLDDIPPKVSINEAVDIAKKYSGEESGKFVNGILDRIKQDSGK